MRISDWSSDVCSSDLCKGWAITSLVTLGHRAEGPGQVTERSPWMLGSLPEHDGFRCCKGADAYRQMTSQGSRQVGLACSMSASFHFRFQRFSDFSRWMTVRSEEHTSELQSLMRISYAVFCLKKKKIK